MTLPLVWEGLAAKICGGRYGAFAEDDAAALQRFQEADVDEILASSSELVRYEVSTGGAAPAQSPRAIWVQRRIWFTILSSAFC